jgi:hypothetical protein
VINMLAYYFKKRFLLVVYLNLSVLLSGIISSTKKVRELEWIFGLNLTKKEKNNKDEPQLVIRIASNLNT